MTRRDDLLNEGLHLAMEWGKDWLKPIQERLAVRHPELLPEELDEVNTLCQAAMQFGHGYVYDLALKSGRDADQRDMEAAMRVRYPWVNARNLQHLFSQGRVARAGRVLRDTVGRARAALRRGALRCSSTEPHQ